MSASPLFHLGSTGAFSECAAKPLRCQVASILVKAQEAVGARGRTSESMESKVSECIRVTYTVCVQVRKCEVEIFAKSGRGETHPGPKKEATSRPAASLQAICEQQRSNWLQLNEDVRTLPAPPEPDRADMLDSPLQRSDFQHMFASAPCT